MWAGGGGGGESGGGGGRGGDDEGGDTGDCDGYNSIIQLTINNLFHCQFDAEQESLLLRIPNLKQSEMQIRFLPEMGKPTRMNTFVSRM